MLRFLSLIIFLFLSAACSNFESLPVPLSSFEQPEDISNETPNGSETTDNEPQQKVEFITMDWDAHREEAPQWNEMTYKALEELGPELLTKRPSDILDFCPNYDGLNLEGKKMFWIYLISVMARFESFFNPSVQYQEAFSDESGSPVISRGLLQLSIESGKGYGCELENAQALHDPQTNLRCGVRILNRWVGRDEVLSRKDGSIWKGGARYWAVFRTYTDNDLVGKVKERSRNAEVCQTQ